MYVGDTSFGESFPRSHLVQVAACTKSLSAPGDNENLNARVSICTMYVFGEFNELLSAAEPVQGIGLIQNQGNDALLFTAMDECPGSHG